ncbi:hypothetical protein OAF63_04350 [Saprospiraceae bacterium]|jgi:S-adenosylmethionine-diacylgycerolhomoserine-N-methlytransferase|nr:hypothetical protein [Saprospiraceae bacterium]
MANNHVRMDGHLMRFLKREFPYNHSDVKYGYGGMWSYFMFLGKKKD